jgi:hypothetical protein
MAPETSIHPRRAIDWPNWSAASSYWPDKSRACARSCAAKASRPLRVSRSGEA